MPVRLDKNPFPDKLSRTRGAHNASARIDVVTGARAGTATDASPTGT
ncbi:MAG: hypothetical protein ACR2RV_08345 [Verrucomicrobiales bacterium]